VGTGSKRGKRPLRGKNVPKRPEIREIERTLPCKEKNCRGRGLVRGQGNSGETKGEPIKEKMSSTVTARDPATFRGIDFPTPQLAMCAFKPSSAQEVGEKKGDAKII